MICLLTGCEAPTASNDPVNEDQTTALYDDTVITEVDTVAIEQKILSAFAVEYSYYNDSLNKEVKAIHYDAVIDCKLNLNGDEWLDYFVIDGFGGGVSAGYFYDGKTGEEILGKENDDFISSGPGREIRTRLIDVDLEDDQQELVVITGGGGTIGLYYYCNVFRYDFDSGTYKSIFSETISSVNWEPEGSPHYVNYIDLLYSESLFAGDFIVQKGEKYETEEFDPTAIKPLKQCQQYHYVFESYFDEFRIDRVTCIGQDLSNEVEDQLALLNDRDAWDEQPDEMLDLVYEVGELLEAQMKKGLLTITDDTEHLNFTASNDGRLNMVTYTYPSGGTAGTIHYPILQWEKADGTYGTDAFYPIEDSKHFGFEVDFYDIQPLPYYEKDLYVLIGTQKGSSSYFSAYAVVIEVKDDSLMFDYPAFDDAYSVLIFGDDINDTEQFCIACMDYDAKNNTLTIEEVGESDEVLMMNNSTNPKEKAIDEKGTIVFEFKNGSFQIQN
jgi:hypothetical protein